ncbi:hypothetical protein VP01_2301g4 [Puccinia sorghi]|uniref:Uncharacterized protein n=1 Tax=Puccinia sorghi TaxID=27349 RepID=A0A0L6V7U8_9BASI|nr:hypothetical protein VP01_2301g4 [Puccinia sorghi]
MTDHTLSSLDYIFSRSIKEPTPSRYCHQKAKGMKKINIEYIFWTPEIKEKLPPTRASYKRKALPAAEETKYIKLPSNKGKIDIKWHIQNLNLSEVKSRFFGAIHIQDAQELGDNSEELNKNGMITWEVSVPHGGPFSAKNKATINNDWVFANFIEVISMPDPNAAAQKNKALKMLQRKHEPEADDDQPPIPSVGGAHSAKIVANICKICAQNPPCENLTTGNHKIPVFINPKNKNEFFWITVDRVTLWAMAMVGFKFLIIYIITCSLMCLYATDKK